MRKTSLYTKPINLRSYQLWERSLPTTSTPISGSPWEDKSSPWCPPEQRMSLTRNQRETKRKWWWIHRWLHEFWKNWEHHCIWPSKYNQGIPHPMWLSGSAWIKEETLKEFSPVMVGNYTSYQPLNRMCSNNPTIQQKIPVFLCEYHRKKIVNGSFVRLGESTK